MNINKFLDLEWAKVGIKKILLPTMYIKNSYFRAKISLITLLKR